MNRKKVEKASKLIARRMNVLEKRFMEARNDLEFVQVINDMEDLLEAEIFQWTALLDDEKAGKSSDKVVDVDFIVDEIKKLQDVNDMLVEHRDEKLEKAKVIYKAMKNSHVEVAYTKYVSDGY